MSYLLSPDGSNSSSDLKKKSWIVSFVNISDGEFTESPWDRGFEASRLQAICSDSF